MASEIFRVRKRVRVNKEKIADLETELFKERLEKLVLEQRIEKINEVLKKKN